MTAGHQLSSLIRQIIKNGEIKIDAQHWLWLNQNFNPEEIKQLISMAVDEYEIPLPIKTLSILDAKKSFLELQRFDALSLIKTGRFFWRHREYKLKPKSWTYIASSNVGNDASNFFHQRLRFASDHAKYMAPDKI
jgi:hypothetical protein